MQQNKSSAVVTASKTLVTTSKGVVTTSKGVVTTSKRVVTASREDKVLYIYLSHLKQHSGLVSQTLRKKKKRQGESGDSGSLL